MIRKFGATGIETQPPGLSLGQGTGGTADVGDVLSGKTFTNDLGQKTGTMTNRGAVTITPGTTNQAIAAGYHNGSGVVAGDADLVAGNIKNGVNIFGVTGAMVPIIEPGDNTLFYLANTVAISSTTPYKMKEVKLDKAGIYRVSFQLWHEYGETYNRWAYARIYINGSPVGTTRSSGLTSATTFTEDITVNANDLLQIYLWCNIDSQGFPRLSQMYVKVLNLQSGTINMN